MSFTVSWWLLALVVGATAPMWVRAITNHWKQLAQQRSKRIVAQFEQELDTQDDGNHPTTPPPSER